MQTSHKQLGKKYSIKNLYNDIARQFKDEKETAEKELRDVIHILKVFNYFVTLVQDIEHNKDFDAEKVIKNRFDNDSSLFSYTFFVSSRYQFDYSWSYLRKQWEEYIKTLNEACKFILDMIDKVNFLNEHQLEFIANEFVFEDIFILSFSETTRLPYIEIKWENINNLFNIRNSYHVSAKAGDAIIMTMKISLGQSNNTESFLSPLVNWHKNDCVQKDETK